MQEHTVTIGTTPHALELLSPCYGDAESDRDGRNVSLPEAQLDRFLMKILVRYPSRSDLRHEIVRGRFRRMKSTRYVLDRDAILGLRDVAIRCWSRRMCNSYRDRPLMATQPGRVNP